jgi:hypothetical protein
MAPLRSIHNLAKGKQGYELIIYVLSVGVRISPDTN